MAKPSPSFLSFTSGDHYSGNVSRLCSLWYLASSYPLLQQLIYGVIDQISPDGSSSRKTAELINES